jgi:hypothetical protein
MNRLGWHQSSFQFHLFWTVCVLFSLPCTALHGCNVSAAHCGTRRRIQNREPGCPSFL